MNTLVNPDPASCSLLLAIARAAVDPDAVHSAAGAVEDWEGFLRLTETHRMSAMAFRRLEGMTAAVPSAILQALAAEYERNLCQSMLSAAELLQVLDALGREQIPAMPFKGIVLAASAYREPGLRACGDLDLLIRHEDLERATAILLERGFRRITPAVDGVTVHEYTFQRAEDGAIIELRWTLDLIYARYKRDLGLEWVWADRRSVRLNGIDVPNPTPEKTLILLCMHASKHVWSRLSWVCDVAQLIASSPNLDWEAALSEARALGLWKPLALGILLAQRMAGARTNLPQQSSIQRDRSVAKLASHFERNLVRSPGAGPYGRIPYNIRLLDYRDRIRVLFSPGFLRPNDRDRAAFPFAGPPALYYLLRPIRLMLDRSAR